MADIPPLKDELTSEPEKDNRSKETTQEVESKPKAPAPKAPAPKEPELETDYVQQIELNIYDPTVDEEKNQTAAYIMNELKNMREYELNKLKNARDKFRPPMRNRRDAVYNQDTPKYISDSETKQEDVRNKRKDITKKILGLKRIIENIRKKVAEDTTEINKRVTKIDAISQLLFLYIEMLQICINYYNTLTGSDILLNDELTYNKNLEFIQQINNMKTTSGTVFMSLDNLSNRARATGGITQQQQKPQKQLENTGWNRFFRGKTLAEQQMQQELSKFAESQQPVQQQQVQQIPLQARQTMGGGGSHVSENYQKYMLYKYKYYKLKNSKNI